MNNQENNYNYFEKDCHDFDADFSNPLAIKDPMRKLIKLLWRGSGSRRRFEQAMNILPFELNGKTVLEVGCGCGYCSLHLAKLGAFTTGIDFSQNMLKLAENNKKKYLYEITGSCSFESSNIFTYLPNKNFFLVFALGVIDYIEANKINIFLEKAASLSEKWVLVAFPLKPTIFYLVRKIWLRYFKACNIIHFTKKEIQQMCDKTKLDVINKVYHAGYLLCLMKKR